MLGTAASCAAATATACVALRGPNGSFQKGAQAGRQAAHASGRRPVDRNGSFVLDGAGPPSGTAGTPRETLLMLGVPGQRDHASTWDRSYL